MMMSKTSRIFVKETNISNINMIEYISFIKNDVQRNFCFFCCFMIVSKHLLYILSLWL